MAADVSQSDVIAIAPQGDVVLQVLFESLKSDKAPSKEHSFLVQRAVLKNNSVYFAEKLDEAPVGKRYTLVKMDVNDERFPMRHLTRAFTTMLEILHFENETQNDKTDKETKNEEIEMVPALYALLALQADQFACEEAVASFVRSGRLRVTQVAVIESRQKVFASWLLKLPIQFRAGTRDMVLQGSLQWGNMKGKATKKAPWWDLPNGLEEELWFRRRCIVNCLFSIPRYFLQQYLASTSFPQCPKYSSECDAHQFLQIARFLHDGKLQGVELSNSDIVADIHATHDVNGILAHLMEDSTYPFDDHDGCQIVPRMQPALGFFEDMVKASSIAIDPDKWAAENHGGESWAAVAESTFEFTESIANNSQLHYGDMEAASMARQLFTAKHWNWFPDKVRK